MAQMTEEGLKNTQANKITVTYRVRGGSVTEVFETTADKRARTQARESLAAARVRHPKLNVLKIVGEA